ncbi:malto-oligosyltrehalose synthase [Achromobacter pestifer]
MSAPRATVRLQLHADFTFEDACAQLPYYAALGISHLYLSPITQARDGSSHGYDVIDHGTVSAPLGGEAALAHLAHQARSLGIGLIADIVPNHMAAHPSNAWWADVLRHGRNSPHARCFDIDWCPPERATRGKILLPILAEPYGVSLDAGDVTLAHDAGTNEYSIAAGGLRLPVASDFNPGEAAPAAVLAGHDPASTSGKACLHALLERQHYRLAWWRTGPEQINWRRFFEINELVGVRVEDDAVFDAVHALAMRLYRTGILDGLRIDHVDGLASPGRYLRRLRSLLLAAGGERERAGLPPSPYLVVEKILAHGETLDSRWPADGTTGYDFMDQASALLHDPAAQPALEALWRDISGDARDAATQLRATRTRILTRHFPAELRSLLQALARLVELDPRTRDWTHAMTHRVLSALLAAFPVYRTYAEDGGRSEADQASFQIATHLALSALGGRADSAEGRLLSQLDQWLDGAHSVATHGGGQEQAVEVEDAGARALRRFQQLTPPLAAKSLEDTLFYRYAPLLSRNEVGSSAERFALSPSDFYSLAMDRATTHPQAMLATATHDHKRGEDVRARLATLTEAPEKWASAALAWMPRLAPADLPAYTDRYMLLQSLVGAWPLELGTERLDQDATAAGAFLDRIGAWQQKALREAKLHTSWIAPNLPYERAARHCVEALSNTSTGRTLLHEIGEFAQRVAPAGLINSLTQTLLRNTLPGVPDLYQGTELWDFSLVDPDNRRPVDYPARTALLASHDVRNAMDMSAAAWRSGAIKQSVIQRTLILRARHPGLFNGARYREVAVHGPRAENVIAYLISEGDKHLLIVAPRLCALNLVAYTQGQAGSVRDYWDGTYLELPLSGNSPAFQDVLSGRSLPLFPATRLPVAALLRACPIALCAAGDMALH